MKKYYKFSIIILLFINSCGRSINSETKMIEVSRGESIHEISRKLEIDKIINNTTKFRIIAKLLGKDSQLKTGLYQIPPHTSYQKILKIVSSGKSLGILITIPEGFNSFQIAYLLEKNEIVSAKDFLNEISKPYRLAELGIPVSNYQEISKTKLLSDFNGYKFIIPVKPNRSIEGYLFPDTYSLKKHMSVSNLVNIMQNRFFEVVDKKILAEIEKKNLNLNELITFASIVQKEAGNDAEMPEVAGVYKNRLEKNMPLQADPTLIYALILDGEYTGDIKNKHLRPPWPSLYNTYYTKKLPPGPIANPGKNAILASLNPKKHDYIFFVGNPDSNNHTYSKTLAEHNEAVALWVKKKKKRKND